MDSITMYLCAKIQAAPTVSFSKKRSQNKKKLKNGQLRKCSFCFYLLYISIATFFNKSRTSFSHSYTSHNCSAKIQNLSNCFPVYLGWVGIMWPVSFALCLCYFAKHDNSKSYQLILIKISFINNRCIKKKGINLSDRTLKVKVTVCKWKVK